MDLLGDSVTKEEAEEILKRDFFDQQEDSEPSEKPKRRIVSRKSNVSSDTLIGDEIGLSSFILSSKPVLVPYIEQILSFEKDIKKSYFQTHKPTSFDFSANNGDDAESSDTGSDQSIPVTEENLALLEFPRVTLSNLTLPPEYIESNQHKERDFLFSMLGHSELWFQQLPDHGYHPSATAKQVAHKVKEDESVRSHLKTLLFGNKWLEQPKHAISQSSQGMPEEEDDDEEALYAGGYILETDEEREERRRQAKQRKSDEGKRRQERLEEELKLRCSFEEIKKNLRKKASLITSKGAKVGRRRRGYDESADD
ncbi:hypothetical protein ADUPG1_000068, partial [Aduncisulcus paluster]